jgi:hypothetical protein
MKEAAEVEEIKRLRAEFARLGDRHYSSMTKWLVGGMDEALIEEQLKYAVEYARALRELSRLLGEAQQVPIPTPPLKESGTPTEKEVVEMYCSTVVANIIVLKRVRVSKAPESSPKEREVLNR